MGDKYCSGSVVVFCILARSRTARAPCVVSWQWGAVRSVPLSPLSTVVGCFSATISRTPTTTTAAAPTTSALDEGSLDAVVSGVTAPFPFFLLLPFLDGAMSRARTGDEKGSEKKVEIILLIPGRSRWKKQVKVSVVWLHRERVSTTLARTGCKLNPFARCDC